MRWEQFLGHVGVVSLSLLKSSQFKTDLESYNENRDRNTLEALFTVVRMIGNRQPPFLLCMMTILYKAALEG